MDEVTFEFEKLMLYQEARAFRKRIYKLSHLLPKYEYKLSNQMRDAARSLTNCLAEGHGRFTYPDRIHFCRESRGSLVELVDDANLCMDENYAESKHLLDLKQDGAKLLRRMNGYLKYLEAERKKLAAAKRTRRMLEPA